MRQLRALTSRFMLTAIVAAMAFCSTGCVLVDAIAENLGYVPEQTWEDIFDDFFDDFDDLLQQGAGDAGLDGDG